MYAVNESGTVTGALTAEFMAYGTGHGSVKITMPDGEVLKGDYSIVRGGSIGFGRIYAAAYGTAGYATANATSSSFVTERVSEGTAIAIGNKGTSIQCEFYNDNLSGHGKGACKDSHDIVYRLMY